MVFGMEDLVANAFLGLLEKRGNGCRKIPMRNLAKYKSNVLNSLNKANQTAVIPTSRNYAAKFFYRYRDYFSFEENDKSDNYICLKEDKTQADLWRRFVAFIPDKAQHYFLDEKNLKPILSEKNDG
jgi:hypothetical protein